MDDFNSDVLFLHQLLQFGLRFRLIDKYIFTVPLHSLFVGTFPCGVVGSTFHDRPEAVTYVLVEYVGSNHLLSPCTLQLRVDLGMFTSFECSNGKRVWGLV